MTTPRQVLPGATYLVTRRCTQRQFLLKPSPTTNATFLFLLALAANRYAVEIHAFCVLSNHVHMVVTDVHARLPAFQQFLDALVARALNVSLGRQESFWAPSSYSAVRLASPLDVVEKTAYVLANPVAAGLVPIGRLWPGLWSSPERIGGAPFEVQRPKRFFDEKGSLPASVSLQLTVPPGFASADEFRDLLLVALAERETQAQRDHRGRFLGVARVLAQRVTGRPRSREEPGGLNPRVAARDKWKRIEVLERLERFQDAYRVAWAERRAGNLDATFPFGTYLLRVLHGVPCSAFG